MGNLSSSLTREVVIFPSPNYERRNRSSRVCPVIPGVLVEICAYQIFSKFGKVAKLDCLLHKSGVFERSNQEVLLL